MNGCEINAVIVCVRGSKERERERENELPKNFSQSSGGGRESRGEREGLPHPLAALFNDDDDERRNITFTRRVNSLKMYR